MYICRYVDVYIYIYLNDDDNASEEEVTVNLPWGYTEKSRVVLPCRSIIMYFIMISQQNCNLQRTTLSDLCSRFILTIKESTSSFFFLIYLTFYYVFNYHQALLYALREFAFIKIRILFYKLINCKKNELLKIENNFN